MKISLPSVAFESAVKVATYPNGYAASWFNGKPVILFTGKWLTINKEGVPVYPAPYAQARGRYWQRGKHRKKQKKVKAKLHELEKRLNALEASKRETDL